MRKKELREFKEALVKNILFSLSSFRTSWNQKHSSTPYTIEIHFTIKNKENQVLSKLKSKFTL